MIENSRWIKKFESDLDKKKIFCIYGNIDDNFFWNRNIVDLKEYFNQNFESEKVFYFFDTEYFEKIVEIQNRGDDENDETELEYSLPNFIKIVEGISDRKENYIVIKDPKLFFGDLCSGTTSNSLRFFLESINSKKWKKKKIIFISEELGDFPNKLIVNNPHTSTIFIDFPEEDERKFYLAEVLKIDHLLKMPNIQETRERRNIFIKLTDKRKLKELENIVNKAKSIQKDLKTMSPKDIINYYDFGEQTSPWLRIQPADIKNLRENLKKRVKGQDKAIEFVKKVVYRAKLNLNGIMQKYSTRPKGVLFFTGPSGVGKTELAKALTECIFGDESAFKRFDMSEYKSPESINKLIGSDPGYVGYNEGGQLTNWILQNPYSVILFDEIDKANVKIWDTFLQILEDGRLTDNKGNIGYFNESIIIFTSNIGNAEYDREKILKNEDEEKYYKKKLTEYFVEKVGRVEILNRFGENIVVFNHIEKEIFKEIISNKLDLIIENIEKIYPNLKFNLSNKKDIIDFIEKHLKDGEKFGARLVNSTLENLFINEFSEFYMVEELDDKEARINIKIIEGEELKFECILM